MAVQQTSGSTFGRDKTGLRRVALKFIVERENGAEPWNTLDSFTPPDLPGDVEEIGRKASKRDDGDWDLDIEFGGGAEERFKEDVEIDWAGAEDPIETFPYFDQLAKKWGAKFDPQDPAKFDGWAPKIKDPAGSGTIKNPLYGLTHFLNDGAVLRITFNLKNYSARYLRNICKIERPQVKNGRLQGMIEAPDGKNWLKKSVKVKFCGGCFQFVLEYLLSGLGGWIPDIYSPKNPG